MSFLSMFPEYKVSIAHLHVQENSIKDVFSCLQLHESCTQHVHNSYLHVVYILEATY